MEFKTEKLVRFCQDGKQQSQVEKTNSAQTTRKPSLSDDVPSTFQRKSDNIDRIFCTLNLGKSMVFLEDNDPWQRRILDPGSQLVLKWNRIFLISCLVALFIDPLYFFLPSIGNSSCMKMDLNLSIAVTCFRSIADLFYLSHMVLKFRLAYVAPSSRVFGKGELVVDSKKIAMRYLRSDFLIDLSAMLPLPQIVIWFIIPTLRRTNTDHANNALALIVLFQYIPRLYLIFPLSSQIIKATGVVTKTAWAGAAYNLLLYMLASHVLGASWYLLSIERQTTCWRSECRKESMLINGTSCSFDFLDCDTVKNLKRQRWANSTHVFQNCDPNRHINFIFGIFADALTKDVVSSNFLKKYFYCLWWGLQNLSSYGQTLKTSTFIGETLFAILIAIVGLVLFAHLIGNMQTYLQSITVRLEEWRLKRRDTDEWMKHRQLPQNLRKRVRQFVQYKWLTARGGNEEAILKALPKDLRRDIQRHLCLDLVRRVPFFSQMDDQLLDAICERLVSSLSIEGTFIVREGELVTEMLFIIRGRLESSTTNGGRTGFFNSITLRPGDFCGEELLSWALLTKSSLNLPSSTRTVRALVEVEAFALRAEDLKFVANQFRRLHSKKLQHAFRFYSHHWRTWAACFIQAAWRRFKKRRLAKDMSLQESLCFIVEESTTEESAVTKVYDYDHMVEYPTQAKQNIGVNIFASRFAASTMKGAQKMKNVEIAKVHKPKEPDFSVETDDDEKHLDHW